MINVRSFLFTAAASLTILGLSAAPSMAQICYTQSDVDMAQMTADNIGYEAADAENSYNQAVYWAGESWEYNGGELYWVFDRQRQYCNQMWVGNSNSCYLNALASYEADMAYWSGERDWWYGRWGELQSDHSYAQAMVSHMANNMCPT